MNGASASTELLRVSVATYNRVLFTHPQTGILMLALERKATVWNGGDVHVQAQPFGGAVRIFNSDALEEIVGALHYDSERSRREQDFRILIPPSKWDAVKEYCLRHLETPDDSELESLPHRELAEEFAETLQVDLKPDQYTVDPIGFVFENNPVPTRNTNARGLLTVRLYRIFEVYVIDGALCKTMLVASEQCTHKELARRARMDAGRGGKGRSNSILTLPLHAVTEAYLALTPEARFRKIVVGEHELDESILAVLWDVDVPQYQRL